MLGPLSNDMTLMESFAMLYQVLGLSSASDIQMELFKSSKLGPVHEAISNLKELISLKLMPQLSYGQQHCPMDNNKANVHLGDSPRFEVEAGQCPLHFPSWRTRTR